jgi:hypothetical protein
MSEPFTPEQEARIKELIIAVMQAWFERVGRTLQGTIATQSEPPKKS